ncbi:aldo/keto reductase [Methylobacterium sp. J-090]|uniref:aldo/keto reductase n=1 Tax=Methylobacterium sp. J-090 TaxID=2836666 RepID=UPI001FBA4CB9|nr:aldo/keto reductase [Methylobacterium sp. J-090]MCJ2083870.1 aldo/keto reductase [Methylobacterium sp. J-090]
MRQRAFGATGRDVPVLGQGTWRLDDDDRTRALAALRAGIEAGLTHIDTAEMYGAAEPLVAEAIAGQREAVFLVSKVLPSNASRAGTIAACERSLKRLGTDRLDSYLLHWPGSHPLEETIAGFEALKASGKILSWGLSNFDVDGLDETLNIAGPGAIACNQVLYHLGERAIEHAVEPWCRRNGVALVAYSPFGSGDFPKANGRGGRVLAGIAEAHAASPHAVALAFLTRHDGVFAIPKTGSPERAVANAAAGDLVLEAAEIAALDAAFPRGPRPRHLPML